MSTPDTAHRWQPDDQLVPALLAGTSRTMADLEGPDRCWAVAGLTLAGLTADDIADRMDCSLRLVRAVRAEPMTQVCLTAQTDAEHFAEELRLARTELARSATAHHAAVAENDRLRGQLDRMIAAATGEPPRCSKGHLFDRGNTYYHPRTGTRQCRTCHRERQQEYRDARRVGASVMPADSTAPGDTPSDAGQLTSAAS